MNTAGRLGLYAAGVAVAFGAAFAIAGAVVPESAVTDWKKESSMQNHDGTGPTPGDSHAGGTAAGGHDTLPAGVAVSANGLLLPPVAAPATVGEAGELSFRIEQADGTPVVRYTEEHGKDLHLIVVRTDGAGFRHVHPALDERTGTWSIPWTWTAAGTYRVYTDFTRAGDESGVTLTRTLEVAGEYAPVVAAPIRVATVDGFTVTLGGDLVAGGAGMLTATVERDGEPVTGLQPYLGAFGHLVALRQGDLAYLHVHPEGEEPEAGDTSGPTVSFHAEAPTAGRYLLYFDFQVDGAVHSAPFVLDAVSGAGASSAPAETDMSGH
jgi:hypothetical protein